MSAVFCYDLNGNMTQRIEGSDTYTFTYDDENRLVTGAKNGVTLASYTYDGDGKRVKVEEGVNTTYYIGDYYEWRTYPTVKAVKYYYAAGQRIAMRQPTTLTWLLGDHLGSATITATENGALDTEQRYTAWGQTRSGSVTTDRQYTGQISEPQLGIYFYNARYYDPYLNRFLSADTIIPDPYEPLSYDRYIYVRNNPVNGTDPTGHCYKMINGELAPQCVKYWKDYTAALIKPQIVSRSEWGAHEPGSIPLINGAEFNEGRYSKNNEEGYMPYSEKYPGMTLDEILDTIVIHHTATENDTVLSLQEKEMANGYYDFPYQYVISPDGTIYEGRSIDVRGAHVQDGNTGKIGVALLGDFRSNTPSEAQYQSAVKLAKWLDVKYGIEELGGHNEFNATICPGPNAQTLTDRLKGSFAK